MIMMINIYKISFDLWNFKKDNIWFILKIKQSIIKYLIIQ